MRQVGGFLRVLWFPPPIKLTATIYKNVTEILLKVALNTITLTIFHIKSIPKQEKSIINNDLSNTINLVFTLDKYYKNLVCFCSTQYSGQSLCRYFVCFCSTQYSGQSLCRYFVCFCSTQYSGQSLCRYFVCFCSTQYSGQSL
jgi:hypothetical protein